jgi:cGMP-dependent protein kinase
MGNSNLEPTHIDNLILLRTTSLNLSQGEEVSYKESIKAEKKKMKLICKHNEEEKDSQLIEKCISNHFLLKLLEKPAIYEIVRQLSYYQINPNVEIFSQCQATGYFYILSNGICEIIRDNTVKQLIGSGTCFGELSLIYECDREYTVRTKTECFVWAMEKKNFLKIIEHIISINFENNNKACLNYSIFNTMSQINKNVILNKLCYGIYPANKPIYSVDDYSYCLYLIKEGEVEIRHKDKIIATYESGDFLGLLSVLNQSNRVFEAVPKCECKLYSISTHFLSNLCGENYISEILLAIIKAAFIKYDTFKKINFSFLSEVFNKFTFTFYENKDVIILNKNEPKNKYIVIPIVGDLLSCDDDSIICSRTDLLFGDEIFTNNSSLIEYDIKCSKLCIVAKCKTEDIINHLNCSFVEYADKYTAINQLKNAAIFKNFTESKFEEILQKLNIQKVKKTKNLIKEGEEGNKFYIIKNGSFDVYIGGKYMRTLNENEYLGERSLFFKEKRSATVTAKVDSEVYYLDKVDFDTVIDTNLKEYLSNRLYLQDDTVQLTDLIYYKNLGKGSYGNVSLVENTKNKFFYAIKNISNKQILYCKLTKNIDLERSILLQIDHPFIVKLVKTLKDNNYIYYLMDYIKGKELFDALLDIGILSTYQAQFYICSIMLAAKYLHERKFIYRDIKPENIMILTNGYMKLIDFGTAKILKDKTNTIIGTPQYMAPEVIMGDYYSFEIDYWSIGICLYEFICGNVPFGENANDPLDIYVSIINR